MNNLFSYLTCNSKPCTRSSTTSEGAKKQARYVQGHGHHLKNLYINSYVVNNTIYVIVPSVVTGRLTNITHQKKIINQKNGVAEDMLRLE